MSCSTTAEKRRREDNKSEWGPTDRHGPWAKTRLSSYLCSFVGGEKATGLLYGGGTDFFVWFLAAWVRTWLVFFFFFAISHHVIRPNGDGSNAFFGIVFSWFSFFSFVLETHQQYWTMTACLNEVERWAMPMPVWGIPICVYTVKLTNTMCPKISM